MAKRRRERRAARADRSPAEPSSASEAAPRRPRRRRSWGQRTLIGLGVVTSMACLAAAGIVGYARYRFEQIPRYGDITLASAATGEPQNFLIVGSDSRE